MKELNIQARKNQLIIAKIESMADIGTWEWDIFNDKLVLSDKLYKIYGLKTEEFKSTYQAFIDILHFDEREKVKEIIEQLLIDHKSVEFYNQVIRQDGTTRYIRNKADIICDELNQPIFIIGLSHDITDKQEKKIFETNTSILEETNRKINNILESLTDPFFSLDLDWKFTYINYQAEKLLDRKKEELIGKNIWEEYPQPVDSVYYTQYSKAMRQKETVEFEHYFKNMDKWFSIRAFYSNNGLSVYFRDITEKRNSEQAQKFLAEAGSLLISSLDYEITLENISKIAVPQFADWCAVDIIKNNELIRLAVSHQDINKINLAKEFVTKYPVKLDDKEGPANIIRTGKTEYMKDIPDQIIESIENPELKEYIKKLSINSYISVPLKMNGNAIGIITFVNEKNNRLYTEKDVELAEELARRASLAIENAHLYQKTKETEESFRFLAESIPQQIWTADPNGALNYVNQKVVAYCNLPYDQIIGQGWQDIVHPDDLETTNQLWINSITTGENYEVEFRLFDAKENMYKWYIGRALPLKNNKGEISKWFGTNTDVHQLKDVKEKLARKSLELENSNQELQNFAYIASHDLQEPLRTMSSYASLIERRNKDKLDETTIEFLNIIINASKRMKSLIEDLLEYSQVGKQDFRDVDLNETIKSVIINLKTSINENNAVLNYKKLPLIKAIPTQMVQIFQNLISNSIKYRSEQNPIINISFIEKPKEWEFIISDNGLGIEDKYYEKIFIIFQRLHEKGKYPGTGIGLATCKKIIEIHHGNIWLESEQNKGSKFFFTISKYL